MIFSIAAVITLWVVCGVFAYGRVFAYFEGEYAQIACPGHTKENKEMALLAGLLGPVGLIVTFTSGCCGHGLKWRSS